MEYVKEYIVDVALLGIFAFNVFIYYKKSFTKTVLEFLGFFAAAVVAKLYSEPAANILTEKTDFFPEPMGKEKAALITAIALFLCVSIGFKVLVYYIDKWVKLPAFKTANKVLGLVLGIVIGLAIVGACVALIKALELSGNAQIIEIAEKSRVIKIYTELISKGYPVVAQLIKKGV